MIALQEKERLYAGNTIIFGSDFGSEVDNQRAIGSVRKINPSASVISVGFSLRPFCITSGAVELEAMVQDCPPGIFVWIVDPGVGTRRKGLVVETRGRSTLIGPDNGLLLPAARLTGIEKIWELNREALGAGEFSIFDGRDLFMKAAGYLSKGISLAEIAQSISEDKIVPLNFEQNQVVRIDGTGNVVLEHPCNGNYTPGQTGFILDRLEGFVPYVKSFNDVSEGELGFLKGSIGERLWLFRNGVKAADTLGVRINELLNISPVRPLTPTELRELFTRPNVNILVSEALRRTNSEGGSAMGRLLGCEFGFVTFGDFRTEVANIRLSPLFTGEKNGIELYDLSEQYLQENPDCPSTRILDFHTHTHQYNEFLRFLESISASKDLAVDEGEINLFSYKDLRSFYHLTRTNPYYIRALGTERAGIGHILLVSFTSREACQFFDYEKVSERSKQYLRDGIDPLDAYRETGLNVATIRTNLTRSLILDVDDIEKASFILTNNH